MVFSPSFDFNFLSASLEIGLEEHLRYDRIPTHLENSWKFVNLENSWNFILDLEFLV